MEKNVCCRCGKATMTPGVGGRSCCCIFWLGAIVAKGYRHTRQSPSKTCTCCSQPKDSSTDASECVDCQSPMTVLLFNERELPTLLSNMSMSKHASTNQPHLPATMRLLLAHAAPLWGQQACAAASCIFDQIRKNVDQPICQLDRVPTITSQAIS